MSIGRKRDRNPLLPLFIAKQLTPSPPSDMSPLYDATKDVDRSPPLPHTTVVGMSSEILIGKRGLSKYIGPFYFG